MAPASRRLAALGPVAKLVPDGPPNLDPLFSRIQSGVVGSPRAIRLDFALTNIRSVIENDTRRAARVHREPSPQIAAVSSWND